MSHSSSTLTKKIWVTPDKTDKTKYTMNTFIQSPGKRVFKQLKTIEREQIYENCSLQSFNNTNSAGY